MNWRRKPRKALQLHRTPKFPPAIDAILIINVLNDNSGESSIVPFEQPTDNRFIDVNGDSSISPLDAILVINFHQRTMIWGLKAAESNILPTPPGMLVQTIDRRENDACDSGICGDSRRQAIVQQRMKDRVKQSARIGLRKLLFRAALSDPVVRLIDRKNVAMSLGPRGELAAERFLLKQGYWIVERSFGEKVGEVDLVVSDKRSIIFVEVKSRTSDAAGDPTEAVDLEKQRHISQAARLFVVKNRLEQTPVRFDVVSILWPDLEKPPEIKHYQNAFETVGEFQMF